MAAAVHPAQQVQVPICEENTTFQKAISYIPIIGIFNGLRNEISIAQQLGETRTNYRLIGLISVKNDFKIAAVVNSFVSLTVIIAGIALKFFALGNLAILGIALLTTYGVRNMHGIYENRKSIVELQKDPIIFMKKIY